MKIQSNGLSIEVESHGPEDAPAVLLTMGLGLQLVSWPDALLQALLKAGYRVIRYDNRDIGLSSHLDHLGKPVLLWQYIKSSLGLRLRPAYSLQDMAEDALGVLDALGVRRAHVAGVSMGGMISQRIAAHAPQRVLSLASIMSSSGAPGLPGPRPDVTRAMMRRPPNDEPETVVQHALAMLRLVGSPAFPQDMSVLPQQLLANVRRSYHPDGVARQMVAVVSDTERFERLPRITCPTLVIHGDADPLVPMACGRDTAQRIPGARFEAIPGMGHDWAPGVVRHLIDLLIPHFHATRP